MKGLAIRWIALISNLGYMLAKRNIKQTWDSFDLSNDHPLHHFTIEARMIKQVLASTWDSERYSILSSALIYASMSSFWVQRSKRYSGGEKFVMREEKDIQGHVPVTELELRYSPRLRLCIMDASKCGRRGEGEESVWRRDKGESEIVICSPDKKEVMVHLIWASVE